LQTSALSSSDLGNVLLGEGNCHFQIFGQFVLNFEGISIKQYFGHVKEVMIPKHIERLEGGCFAKSNVSSVNFEEGSRL
jgi:hypothetical protein